ncbi:DNA binding domain protein, excisionase family [Syntrophobotulus glycolicus DSM 8271]|uniref:DNA binding domain protein, excisionase family n=1 Tax=Syntrophobotulus glycolicus (strain DSM 8271 / FlGlyR) TaxID=645991 RepID=F0SYN5_SYNGF|nr:helix-turn-helix transcriptional regulator [Syntrophobotulus glycolicus]ADY54836.1 DNA binding domain protein, excisionase family [Syntrophobotulus glycolicus DSM 8271]
MDDSALTPQEVADILKIAKNTVYELIKREELNSYRVGKKVRVDMSDVLAYKNRTKSRKETVGSKLPLSQENQRKNGFVLCGQDVILDILSRYLELHPHGIQTFRSYVGSYGGLYALYQGSVQLATAHLWDGDTGEYNIPFVRRMLPGIPAAVIHLACRQQGFYVVKGNLKSVKGWEDLKREDLTIVNREKGSGTRILLDEHLRILGIDSAKIKGYGNECTTHLAVASAVARGTADLGLGNEKSAGQVKDIDFIPMQTEKYELVMKKEDMNKPPFQAVLEILRSPEFRMEIEGIGGYDLKDMGKIRQ